jgi:hypothetical protein
MITQVYQDRDIFKTDCDTIVITTNTVGVMGRGIALEAKKRFPEMYRHYHWLCEHGLHEVGRPDLWVSPDGDKKLLLFPTKRHWRNPSQLEWIEWGLEYLVREGDCFPLSQIERLAMIPLGCSNGGLNYDMDVKPMIMRYLGHWNKEVVLYE